MRLRAARLRGHKHAQRGPCCVRGRARAACTHALARACLRPRTCPLTACPAPPPTPALADTNILVTLTATHATVQTLSMRAPPRAFPCLNLNGTRMLAAAFDPARQHRAYAVNDAGQLLVLVVPHDQRSTGCKVM